MASRLVRPYFRRGADHREGLNVSFGDVVRVFGFRTVSVGRWVTKEEQQTAANLFFDALCDLMIILQVPESVLSLNGTLSLAFGTGGRKHANAHYHSGTRTLALAKNAGGGSLAHEWFHAFDHYICQRLFESVNASEFASCCWLESHPLREHPLNERLSACFGMTMMESGFQSANGYFKQAVAIDKQMNGFYFAQPQELCARAFEAIIQDHSIKNAFLVSGTKQSDEAKLGLYPQGEHRAQLATHWLNYFALLGQALEHQR